jgi:hypothetical protein
MKFQEVDTNIIVLEAIIHALKDNLVMDQNHMKQKAYQGCFERHFVEGDQGFL